MHDLAGRMRTITLPRASFQVQADPESLKKLSAGISCSLEVLALGVGRS